MMSLMILQTLKTETQTVHQMIYQISKIATMGTTTLFLAANATTLAVHAATTNGQMQLTIA